MTNVNIEIKSRDYWFKTIERLQQNWALIDNVSDDSCYVYFIEDSSFVINEMSFASSSEAISALQRNGFHQYCEDERAQKSIVPPKSPFQHKSHLNISVCSTGWFCC